ncbi:MAG: dTDP-4-dehydrorhamnose reductase [Pseudomonadota bacterium]|jgi:dTDP-4-dehydrorhamnose reductase
MIDCLVTGAGGALGSVLMRVLCEEHKNVYGLVSPHGPAPDVGKVLRVDLTEPSQWVDRVFALAPRTIVHLAAVSKPAAAFQNPDLARAVNVDATELLAELSTAMASRLIYVSTDMVFDGEEAPYAEHHATEPSTFYGRTKLEAECHVLAQPRSLVLRLPLLYGFPEVSRGPTFFESILQALQTSAPIQLFDDEVRTPLWLEDAARACSRLAESDITGVIHAAGPEALSRLDMGRKIAAALGCNTEALRATRRSDHASPEPRPHNLSLDCSRYIKHFGAPPGHDMATALPLVLARGPHRLLS